MVVNHARGQFISKILDVLPDGNLFVFDLGGVETENSRALYAGDLAFVAEPAGAKVEFKSSIAARWIFRAYRHSSLRFRPSSSIFSAIQRRNYFRITTPVWPPLLCRGELADKTPFQFEIKDISLGGLGLFTERDMSDVISPGDILENVEMDLDEYGFFCVDMQLVGQADSKGEVKVMKRLSFKFPALSASQERDLQQVIYELERLQIQKRKRFQD